MRTEDIDWRVGVLRDVMAGFERGLKRIHRRLEEQSWYDGGHAMDDSEPLLGMAFVAAQVYVEGTIGDVWRMRHANGPSNTEASKKFKTECRARDVALIPGVTRIQLIDATANYYKHCEGVSGSWPGTARTLARVGITADSEYPCVRATELLCGKEWRLRVLCNVVTDWRAVVLLELAAGCRGRNA